MGGARLHTFPIASHCVRRCDRRIGGRLLSAGSAIIPLGHDFIFSLADHNRADHDCRLTVLLSGSGARSGLQARRY